MAAVLKFIMETGDPSKWYLLAFGGAIALVVELLGVSSLAFALGMYIPMEYNSPILLGALVAHYVRKSSKDEVLNRARGDRGILVSSGLIAGGALAGVLAALVQFVESDLLCRAWVEQHWPSLFKATLPRVPDVVAGIGAWFASGTKEEVARGVKEWFAKSDVPSWLGLVMFVGICLYIYFDSRRATREDAGPSLQT
jgi:hypothetical protein